MDFFNYRDGRLFAEDIPVERIAKEVGTPCYIYSEATLKRHYQLFTEAFAAADPIIAYSVKANSSLAILKLLKEMGSGFDIVSGGELYRVLKIDGDPKKTVYAGVGKTHQEIKQALEADILMFNVESINELKAINEVAAGMGKTAGVALRINPDVDPKTHRHTTTGKKENKFGIDFETAAQIIRNLGTWPNVKLIGLDTHLGSPINTVDPYVQALNKVLGFLDDARAAGAEIEYLDIGGGFGIEYKGGETAVPADYAKAVLPIIKKSGCRLIIEPGRSIAGNAGILLTQVLYVKKSGDKQFAICDAAMNDLIRPALYEAYHKIWPAATDKPAAEHLHADAEQPGFAAYDVVGPVCESGDCFAKGRVMPEVAENGYLSIFSAGAYGMSMSSNYNSRPRAAEILVDNSEYRVIRERESYEDLIKSERLG